MCTVEPVAAATGRMRVETKGAKRPVIPLVGDERMRFMEWQRLFT
jgi:hypothetical protein